MGIHDREVIRPADRATWRHWLRTNHAHSPGVWIEYPKVHSGVSGPSYDDLVEEALCFGWIDGVVRKVQTPGYKCLHMTPRKSGSIWAKSNKARLQRLDAAGQLTPAGQAAVDRAKRDGSWTLLDDVEADVIADDLARAFRTTAGSRRRFLELSPSRRQQLLFWIYSAKRPATRALRIRAVVDGTAPTGS